MDGKHVLYSYGNTEYILRFGKHVVTSTNKKEQRRFSIHPFINKQTNLRMNALPGNCYLSARQASCFCYFNNTYQAKLVE